MKLSLSDIRPKRKKKSFSVFNSKFAFLNVTLSLCWAEEQRLGRVVGRSKKKSFLNAMTRRKWDWVEILSVLFESFFGVYQSYFCDMTTSITTMMIRLNSKSHSMFLVTRKSFTTRAHFSRRWNRNMYNWNTREMDCYVNSIQSWGRFIMSFLRSNSLVFLSNSKKWHR